MDESDLVLVVLSLIDISLVGSLIVMVMFSGYENFVSTIDTKGTDTLGFREAGCRNAEAQGCGQHRRDLVDPPAARLHAGRQEGRGRAHEREIMWYIILHMTFVLSAVLLGVLDKMSFAKHRDHSPTA